MWSQKNQAIQERNPYQYVPNFKNLAQDYPMFLSLIKGFKAIAEKLGHDTQSLNQLDQYFNQFFKKKAAKRDILDAETSSEQFMQDHPFSETVPREKGRIPLGARAKLGFETNILRLTWIQQLTGLLQDVLVFGAFYVLVIFPDVTPEFELFFAVVGLSLPLLIFLTICGWYYDKRLRVWSPDMIVKVDRNPFSYVAEPRIYAMVFPFFYTVFKTLREAFQKLELDTLELDTIIKFLDDYSRLSSSRDQDMGEAQELRRIYGSVFIDRQKGDS
jgi:hypothetical protein